MPLLNDAQRGLLTQIEDAKRNVEAELQRLNNLLREVERRDADEVALNQAGETAADLIARARAAYAGRRAAIIAAANALPVI